MDDNERFLNRLIRERAVPPKPGQLRIPERERRSWWEFCLGMTEFLENLIKAQRVDRGSANLLGRLKWITLKGTSVFSSADPFLVTEQRRYIDLCHCMELVFALLVDAPEGFADACHRAFGPNRFWQNGDPKEPAEAVALMENWLLWWRNWEQHPAPIAWAKSRAKEIHLRDHLNGGYIPERDALYRTPTAKRHTTEPSVDVHANTRELVSLEEIAEHPSVVDVGLKPRYTPTSLASLEACIRDDNDVSAFAQLLHKGWKKPAI